jgi:hypothetical protein
VANPERSHQQSDPEQQGVDPEPPRDRDNPGAGRNKQCDAEQDRNNPADA